MKNFSKSIVSCISATVAIGISGVVSYPAHAESTAPQSVSSVSPTSLLLSYVRMLFSLVRTWVSSNDVPTGKPAPDMYLEAAQG